MLIHLQIEGNHHGRALILEESAKEDEVFGPFRMQLYAFEVLREVLLNDGD